MLLLKTIQKFWRLLLQEDLQGSQSERLKQLTTRKSMLKPKGVLSNLTQVLP